MEQKGYVPMKCGCNCNCKGNETTGNHICKYNEDILICDDCWFWHTDYCNNCQFCINYWQDKKTERLIDKERGIDV